MIRIRNLSIAWIVALACLALMPLLASSCGMGKLPEPKKIKLIYSSDGIGEIEPCG